MKYKRNRRGQFVEGERILTKIFLAVVFFGAVSMIGVNTIENWFKVAFEVENSQAVEIVQPTWQDEVRHLIKEAGLDVELASKIIQHESWWQPDNSHRNKDGTLDRGLWMISDYWHPEVSDDCAYDYYCSTIQAIRIWQKRGPQEWIAYKHGYVK